MTPPSAPPPPVPGLAAPPLPAPGLADDALLDAVSRAALGYFTDFAHPVSAMARERSGGAFGYDTEATVTTGGTGFGLMAMVAGAARGWLDQGEAARRIARIAAFLETAERHHGVFPHFLDGASGRTVPFGPGDDGGDIVETAFLLMGLIVGREAFPDHPDIAGAVERILADVDWCAHVEGRDLLWHRSAGGEPGGTHLPVRGWHEGLLAFVLGAGAPRDPLPVEVYHGGWAAGEQFATGHEVQGIRIPLGPGGGGPMFLSHYSFLGLDPRGLRDRYADYWEQVTAHARANRAHCIANPHGHPGYGPACWGLSASDTPGGYAAHSPTEDRGVISPTAAVASMPYLPEASMAALRHFVEERGAALWGPFGLADAFRPADGWVAPATLAIDQGPIVVMIENHRSGLIWRLAMGAPEVRRGLARLGFTSPYP